jgi:phage tail sheath protein FI
MSAELLGSKVVIKEEAPVVRSLPALKTAVMSIVGIFQRGPIGEKTLVTSFDEFIRYFGKDTSVSLSVHAVRAFFDGGGKYLYVVRTVHYTDVDTPATQTATKGTRTIQTAAFAPTSGAVTGSIAGPWDLEPGDTLVIELDAAGVPHNGTATFNATAAARECTNAETYALVDSQTLTVKVDRGSVQTITFLTGEFVAIGAATAEEVAAVINAKIVGASAAATSGGTKVTITSDKRGTGSYIEVTGGTANGALAFNVAEVQGTGNVDDIDAVTALEAKTVIEAVGTLTGNLTVTEAVGGYLTITSATTGTTSSVLVNATSTADDEFGFDNATHSGDAGTAQNTLKVDGKYYGAYTDDLRPRVADATSGVASEFNFSIEEGGITVETFPNVTMDDTQTNFIETVVNHATNGSKLVAVTDLDSTAPNYGRPVNGLATALAGGGDGLGSLADTDFIGSAAGKTGIRALDLASDVTMLGIPDRATAAVQNAMWQYGEVTRDGQVFPIFDVPAGLTAAQAVTYFETTAALLEATEFGHMSYPRVKVLNPNTSVYGADEKLTVPASGHIAGMIARVDASKPGGVYEPPAGIEYGKLFGVVGLESDETLDETKRDLLFPKRINPITALESSGGGYFVDGARTAKGSGNFPTVAERRGVSYIEQTIKAGLQVYRHRNNDRKLRQAVTRTVTAFLLLQMKLGAFRSRKPSEAFFVDFGDGLNPDSEVFAGKLNGRVGLATQKPAEFIIVSFSQDTRKLEEELLTATR